MRIVFAGTPAFAAAALAALHAHGHTIACVLTQPERPAGRGMRTQPGAVAAEARRLGLPVEEPPTLKDAGLQARLRELDAEVFVVAAYGMLLPQAVLDIPRRGCINIHASLLPRWRGAAPVQRAIEAGDRETGIAIMQMDAGLDTGAVRLTRTLPIAVDETSASLFARLTALGAQAIVETLDTLDRLPARPQESEGVTYAKKISKAEALVDWREAAERIERRLRAFDPFPGCETRHGEAKLKIWRGELAENVPNAAPGVVIASGAQGLVVQTGAGALRLLTLQAPGGKRLPADQFLRGHPLPAGSVLA
jgi:methionyl-tRNA formyltransferase